MKRNKYKYINGNAVPPNAQIRSEGNGNQKKHFVVNEDGSETQVVTATALRSRLKRKIAPLDTQQPNPTSFSQETIGHQDVTTDNEQTFDMTSLDGNNFFYFDDAMRLSASSAALSLDELPSIFSLDDAPIHPITSSSSHSKPNLFRSPDYNSRFKRERPNDEPSSSLDWSDETDFLPPDAKRIKLNEDQQKPDHYPSDALTTDSEMKGEHMRRNKYRYFNGNPVPPNVKIRQKGKGKQKKRIVVNDAGTEFQVFTESELRRRQLKYPNGADVPADARIRSEGDSNQKKHFVVNHDGSETQVFTPKTFIGRRLKYPDGSDVPIDANIREQGKNNSKKYFVVHDDGSETQVFTAKSLSNRQLKYNDGSYVPADANIREQGNSRKKYFVVHKDGSETQVFTYAALSHRQLKYDNGADVPADVHIREQGNGRSKKYFVVHDDDGSETQVYTTAALSSRQRKSIAPPDTQQPNPTSFSQEIKTTGDQNVTKGNEQTFNMTSPDEQVNVLSLNPASSKPNNPGSIKCTFFSESSDNDKVDADSGQDEIKTWLNIT